MRIKFVILAMLLCAGLAYAQEDVPFESGFGIDLPTDSAADPEYIAQERFTEEMTTVYMWIAKNSSGFISGCRQDRQGLVTRLTDAIMESQETSSVCARFEQDALSCNPEEWCLAFQKGVPFPADVKKLIKEMGKDPDNITLEEVDRDFAISLCKARFDKEIQRMAQQEEKTLAKLKEQLPDFRERCKQLKEYQEKNMGGPSLPMFELPKNFQNVYNERAPQGGGGQQTDYGYPQQGGTQYRDECSSPPPQCPGGARSSCTTGRWECGQPEYPQQDYRQPNEPMPYQPQQPIQPIEPEPNAPPSTEPPAAEQPQVSAPTEPAPEPAPQPAPEPSPEPAPAEGGTASTAPLASSWASSITGFLNAMFEDSPNEPANGYAPQAPFNGPGVPQGSYIPGQIPGKGDYAQQAMIPYGQNPYPDNGYAQNPMYGGQQNAPGYPGATPYGQGMPAQGGGNSYGNTGATRTYAPGTGPNYGPRGGQDMRGPSPEELCEMSDDELLESFIQPTNGQGPNSEMMKKEGERICQSEATRILNDFGRMKLGIAKCVANASLECAAKKEAASECSEAKSNPEKIAGGIVNSLCRRYGVRADAKEAKGGLYDLASEFYEDDPALANQLGDTADSVIEDKKNLSVVSYLFGDSGYGSKLKERAENLRRIKEKLESEGNTKASAEIESEISSLESEGDQFSNMLDFGRLGKMFAPQ